MWQSLMTIDQATSEIKRRKKEKEEERSKRRHAAKYNGQLGQHSCRVRGSQYLEKKTSGSRESSVVFQLM